MTTAHIASPAVLPASVRNLLMLLTLCLIGTLAGGCNTTISDNDILYTNLAEVRNIAQAKPGTVYLIDARAPQDFAAGHIPGANNLQLYDVRYQKDSLDPALARYDMLIVYGEAPNSPSAKGMTKRLMFVGAKEVRMFNGGMLEWTRTGNAVAKGATGDAPAPPPQ